MQRGICVYHEYILCFLDTRLLLLLSSIWRTQDMQDKKKPVVPPAFAKAKQNMSQARQGAMDKINSAKANYAKKKQALNNKMKQKPKGD